MNSTESKIKSLKRYIADTNINISIKDKKVNLLNYQKFKYVFFGGANVLLNWVLFYVIFHYVTFKNNVEILGIITISPYIFALLGSFIITFFTGFLFNFFLVFKQNEYRPRFGNRLLRYFATNMGSLLLNYLLLKLFVEWLHWYPTPSQILCTFLITIYSYIAQRKFTFSKKF